MGTASDITRPLDLPGRLAGVTVEIHGSRGHGAGIRWPLPGLIATCSHVVHDTVSMVRFEDGSEHEARLLLDEPESDIALLMLDDVEEGADRPTVELRTTPLRPGEVLFAMGNPLGEARVLTSGVAIGTPGDDEFIAADLRVLPGNSGGPLVDSAGRVAGIVSMYRGGAAVAVPVSRVQRLIERLDAPAEPPI